MPQLLYYLHIIPMFKPLKIFICLELKRSNYSRLGIVAVNPSLIHGFTMYKHSWMGQYDPTPSSTTHPDPDPCDWIIGFGKLKKQFPTYNSFRIIWNKAKHLQELAGSTCYSPIWLNDMYMELAKLQNSDHWREFGGYTCPSHLSGQYIVAFPLLKNMYFYYIQS